MHAALLTGGSYAACTPCGVNQISPAQSPSQDYCEVSGQMLQTTGSSCLGSAHMCRLLACMTQGLWLTTWMVPQRVCHLIGRASLVHMITQASAPSTKVCFVQLLTCAAESGTLTQPGGATIHGGPHTRRCAPTPPYLQMTGLCYSQGFPPQHTQYGVQK
jgi:hypothetical protein